MRSDLKLWRFEDVHLRNDQCALIQFQSKICGTRQYTSEKPGGAGSPPELGLPALGKNKAAALSHKTGGKQSGKEAEPVRPCEFSMVSEVGTSPGQYRAIFSFLASSQPFQFGLQDM